MDRDASRDAFRFFFLLPVVAEFAGIRTIDVASLNSGEFSYIDGLRFSLVHIRDDVPPRTDWRGVQRS